MRQRPRRGGRESAHHPPLSFHSHGASCAWPRQDINAELFDSFSTFSFALASHGIVAVVRGELVNPTGRRFATVLLPCVTLIALLYAVAGVMGYLQFTNWTCPNISEAYTDDDFVFVGQIGVVLCITGGHPVNMFPLKIAIDKLLFFESAPSHLRRGVISAFCVLSAGAIALARWRAGAAALARERWRRWRRWRAASGLKKAPLAPLAPLAGRQWPAGATGAAGAAGGPPVRNARHGRFQRPVCGALAR